MSDNGVNMRQRNAIRDIVKDQRSQNRRRLVSDAIKKRRQRRQRHKTSALKKKSVKDLKGVARKHNDINAIKTSYLNKPELIRKIKTQNRRVGRPNDIRGKTVKELKKDAKDLNDISLVKGYSKMKKPTVVKEIVNAEKVTRQGYNSGGWANRPLPVTTDPSINQSTPPTRKTDNVNRIKKLAAERRQSRIIHDDDNDDFSEEPGPMAIHNRPVEFSDIPKVKKMKRSLLFEIKKINTSNDVTTFLKNELNRLIANEVFEDDEKLSSQIGKINKAIRRRIILEKRMNIK